MSLVELTGLLGIAIAFLSAVFVPLYLNRRSERRTVSREDARHAAELAEGTEVSWEAINRTLVRERDTFKSDLATQATSHRAEIAEMQEAHRREIADLKRGHGEEMTALSQRLTACQAQVSKLYGELYELQKLLPPRA